LKMQNSDNNAQADEDYLVFLSLHLAALKAARIPPLYWKSLYSKLKNEVFDAGEVFGIMQVEEEEESEKEVNSAKEICYKVIVTRESGLQATDPTSVFLVDHAWTYRVESARQQLVEIPGLLIRMASLMGMPFHGEVPDPDIVDQVLDHMWKYNQTYQLSQGSAEEQVPVWYVMDEFGSRVQHSSHPTCCMAPLFFAPQQVAYSILWPLQDLENGVKFGDKRLDDLLEDVGKRNLRVYTEIKQVLDHLKHPRFQFTDDRNEADIIWAFSHIRDYRKLSEERPHVLLNQFPCEMVLTTKDCLASVARRARGGRGAPWLPLTFNLQTELPQFIKNYQYREK
ncbi:hypothetical protein DNTS_008135, partial [Danionella cerebrum]